MKCPPSHCPSASYLLLSLSPSLLYLFNPISSSQNRYLVHLDTSPKAMALGPLIGFTAVVMTFSKTVLYWLNVSFPPLCLGSFYSILLKFLIFIPILPSSLSPRFSSLFLSSLLSPLYTYPSRITSAAGVTQVITKPMNSGFSSLFQMELGYFSQL